MKKRKLIYFVSILTMQFLLFSCAEPVDRTYRIELGPDTGYTDIRLAVADTLSFRQENGLPLGHVTKTLHVGDNYFMISKGRLTVFDEEGNHVAYLGNKGRAGREYISCSDFWMEDDSVRVYDFNGRKVVSFAFPSNGTRTFSLQDTDNGGYPFSNVQPFNDGYVCRCVWHGNEGESPALAYYDVDFNYVRTLDGVVLRSGLTLGFPLVPGENNTLLYWNPLERDIYRILPDLSVSREFEVSFGEDRNFPSLDIVDEYDLLDRIREPEWMSEHAGMISYVWEWKGRLIFTYLDGNQSHIAVFDEKEGNVVSLRIADAADFVILSCAFDGGKIHFITEDESGELVRIIDLDEYLQD